MWGKTRGRRSDRQAFPNLFKGLLGVLGGAEGNRTPDLLIANEALYHLSYGPKERRRYGPFGRASSGVVATVL